ncbi:hypothetical protein Lupro_08040 [Lutibacter profundi]|uniref:Uncharacterized protein n=1 Tax=Lutibacter profundi TaxID=1622118 RepID=A0A0X8G6X9_9FLAO|nr:hypothetical protein [Lutibacter profundi]AMC11207.1 hypothetical protein Lupro_08040 [Lutibacter profundi]
MKRITQLLLLIITISTQSQDFKPYKIKSGKIVYEKYRYSTHAGFSFKNGVETSFSEQIPYVAEQVIYYWDNFGDIAFEEIYKVSKFGGKLLPKKVKIAERFWVDEHRYYFDVEKNKVSDDPYYLRIKCRENFQYYQIKDSWIETLYMGTEKSATKEILGKEADYYKIDTFQDLYAWKGLVLKNESFATTKKGVRLHPDRTKIAVEIDTVFKIDKKLFHPIWLKRDKLYKSFNGIEIGGILDARQDLLIQAENVEGIVIQKNDILFFVTTKLNLGKIQILNIDKNKVNINFTLYNGVNNIVSFRNYFSIKNNTLLNIDNIPFKTEDISQLDFKYENSKLIPQNNIGIYVLKASRTQKLK